MRLGGTKSSKEPIKRINKNWLTAYLQYTKDTEAPEQFHLWVAVATLASTLRRNVWIDMGHFKWVPNFYIILIGPAGVVTKSTSLRIGEKLLQKVGGIKFGSQSVTWQKLIDEINDASTMDLEQGLAQASITLMVSELGSFLDLESREQIDFLVDVWDGQETKWQRGTMGHGQKEIINPCVNMLAATTPIWIRNNFKQSMIGGGFSSRLVLVMGKHKRRIIAYPGFEGNGLDRSLEASLVNDLKSISKLRGNFTMTKEAIAWGTEWYHDHYEKPKLRKLQGEKFEGYYARKQTHMHKLAMIFSVAESNEMIITDVHLQQANGLLLQMEEDYGEVFEYVESGNYFSQMKVEVSRLLRANPGITKKELYKQVATMVSGKDFESIIGDLAKADLIKQQAIEGQVALTMKTPVSKVNEK